MNSWYETRTHPLKGTKRSKDTIWNVGLHHTAETRKKISEGMRRYWNNRKGG